MTNPTDNGARRVRETLGLSPSGKKIFVWRGPDDVGRLTEAVAEAGITELFEVDDVVVWRRDGKSVGVSRNVLHEIVTAYIETVRLTPSGEVEFYSFDFAPGNDVSKAPNQGMLTIMQNDLKRMVAKGPSQPQQLPPRILDEVRQRLAVGEQASMIAEAYHVDVDIIRKVGR